MPDSSGFTLITDSRQIPVMNSMRVMVAAALLYTFTVILLHYSFKIHFLFVGIAYFFRDDVKI